MSDAASSLPVAVIGAGPVGLAAALFLEQSALVFCSPSATAPPTAF